MWVELGFKYLGLLTLYEHIGVKASKQLKHRASSRGTGLISGVETLVFGESKVGGRDAGHLTRSGAAVWTVLVCLDRVSSSGP